MDRTFPPAFPRTSPRGHAAAAAVVALGGLLGCVGQGEATPLVDLGALPAEVGLPAEDALAEDTPNHPGDESCAQLTCPLGLRCQLFADDEDGRLIALCVESDPTCDDVTCGPAASCQLVEQCAGPGPCQATPACVALACEETATAGCEASCSTGYLVGGAADCACCSPADEAAPVLCLVDGHCGAGQACDHASGCLDGCEPGKPCAEVCYGRCAAEDLVVTVHP